MSPARSSSPLRVASRTLAAAVPAVVLLVVAQSGLGASQAETYLDRLSASAKATYTARHLVVYLGAPQSAAVLETRYSPEGRYMRAESATDITRVWRDPSHGLISDRTGSMEEIGPPAVPFEKEAILDKYDIEVGEPSRFLGVSIVPLDLTRRTDRARVERLWIQPDNGVVYRRELFGPRGGLIGMTTILDMQWGSSQGAEPYDGEEPDKVLVSSRQGVPAVLPYGYRLVGAYGLDAKGRPARQWVYSDGLHALSVFRVDGTLRRPKDTRAVQIARTTAWAGAGPGTWSWEGRDAVWTVVAEEPQLDPVQLTRALPQGGPSVLDRMGAWWARAYHWVVARVR